MRTFEFNPDKSQANLVKHGIDFAQAQQLWDDPRMIEVQARSTDEPRSIVIAKLQGKMWSAVITVRSDCIRIISVRRSRPAEVTLYES
jgi:uncharacterized protein